MLQMARFHQMVSSIYCFNNSTCAHYVHPVFRPFPNNRIVYGVLATLTASGVRFMISCTLAPVSYIRANKAKFLLPFGVSLSGCSNRMFYGIHRKVANRFLFHFLHLDG